MIYDIHLNSECDAIGSGHRRVEVRSIGHKHVYAREVRRSPSSFSRISRKIWNELPRRQVEDPSVNNLIYLGSE